MIPAKYWSPTKKLMLLGAMAGGKAVEDTATGNPLTFQTDLARPLKSLLIPFTPIQEGTGDPSPQNIRSIIPWNGLSVNHSEENLIDVSVFPSKLSGGITYTNNGDGSITLDGECIGFNPQSIALPVNLPAGKYYLTINNDKAKTGTGNVYIGMNDINGVDYGAGLGSVNAKATINASAPLRRMYINIFAGAELDNVTIKPMLVSGEGYADFKPYTGEKHDISFTSPVYGGVLDAVTGVLSVEYFYYQAKWKDGRASADMGDFVRKTFPLGAVDVKAQSASENERFCNIAVWKTNYNEDSNHYYVFKREGENPSAFVFLPEDTDGETVIQIVNAFVTPQEIQLTPEQITALVGDNTIWSDADGSMTAVFFKKG